MTSLGRPSKDSWIIDATDRQRLVRLCARLSGSYDAADDLAQETLLEAWRHRERLQSPEGYWAWLTAIARNVSMRWIQAQRRERSRAASRGAEDEEPQAELPTPESGLELELERDEVAALLDRALALLPAESRAALVDRYVEGLPQAEIAERLRLSEGAVEARLHRGKLFLRKLLAADLREEAESLGILVPAVPQWQNTRIWCPFCGRRYLEAWIDRGKGIAHYRCAGACVYDGTVIGGGLAEISAGLKSPKVILTHQLLALHEHYARTTAEGGRWCERCRRPVPMAQRPGSPAGCPDGIEITCASCGESDNASIWHLGLDTPAAQRFWKRHPRMTALPGTEVESDGRPALVSGFASADGTARLDVVFDRSTLAVVRTSDGS